MNYREIVAVTGLGGLFQLMSTKGDGAIVRNLSDNTTKFVPARLHQVTPLESIEVYTEGANVRLHEVFEKMKESDAALPDAKASSNDLKAYFGTVFPEMDATRVYDSDRKKMVKWFGLLKSADLLDFSMYNQQQEEEAGNNESDAGAAEAEAQVAEHKKGSDTDMPLVEEGGEEAKPAKKARTKKAEDTGTAAEGGEAPAKKAARKKKADGAEEDGEEKPAKKKAKKKKEDGE